MWSMDMLLTLYFLLSILDQKERLHMHTPGDMHKHVLSSVIHNGKENKTKQKNNTRKLETTQMSVNSNMNKYAVE